MQRLWSLDDEQNRELAEIVCKSATSCYLPSQYQLKPLFQRKHHFYIYRLWRLLHLPLWSKPIRNQLGV